MNKLLSTLATVALLWTAPAGASDLVSFEPACRSHIIHRYEEVSRDYTYLEFYRNPQPCRLQGIIGGEHQTFINVIGFTGDRYSVSLIEKEDHPSFSISGDGIRVSAAPESNEKIVEIEVMETFFSIAVYAYPYGEYQMTIKKL
ncbi:hypothetical protein [Psychromonas ossibalaenae]|uniref:hypothetical protein n=1 Tax=Psychromonas ossibalaenae TaxID=444922 RepID=UPI00037DE68A|nr:hypothetical protein [Psychromonas ossibalaenae]